MGDGKAQSVLAFGVATSETSAQEPASKRTRLRPIVLTRREREELHKLELRERANADPETKARRARDAERINGELAKAAERWSSAKPQPPGVAPMTSRELLFAGLDPEGYAEHQAIVELSRLETWSMLDRKVRELAPPTAEHREAIGALLSSIHDIRYGEELRASSDPSLDLTLSENRELCNPQTGNDWLGCGRGGLWWAGNRLSAEAARALVAGSLSSELPQARRACVARRLPRCSGHALELGPGALELGPGALELGPGALELGPGALELGPGALELGPGALELVDAGALELVGPDLGPPELLSTCLETTNRIGAWEPKKPSQRKAKPWWKGRREAQRLARGLIRIQPDRQANCRRLPLGGEVGLHQHRERLDDGTPVTRLSWAGNETCGSVWACPECSRLIRARRARELAKLNHWAGDRAWMVTMTLAHELGDDLAELRAGIANAWRRMIRGAPWQRFVEKCEIVGYVKALEVKHGAHGWHPHIHAIVVGRLHWPDLELGSEAKPIGVTEWIARRWRECVVTELGPEHAPSLEWGTSVTPIEYSSYLVKMGLELTLDWTKLPNHDEGHTGGRRIPWQIAADWVRHRDPYDRALWHDYVRSMKGARQLTWSRHLRDRAELGPELEDEEIARDSGREVGTIDRADWQWLTTTTGEHGYPLTAHALEVGEAAGLEAMRAWIEKRRGAVPGAGLIVKRQEKERVNPEWHAEHEPWQLKQEAKRRRSRLAMHAGSRTPPSSGERSS